MKRGAITIEPNRITVTLSPEGTVRMTAEEIASIFHVTAARIERHIKKIFAEHELDEHEVRTEQVKMHGGKRYLADYYNLDMIIALCFRIDSYPSKAFRQWIGEQIVRSLKTKPIAPIILQIRTHAGGAN